MRRPNDEPYNGATMKPEAPAGPIHTPMMQHCFPPMRIVANSHDLPCDLYGNGATTPMTNQSFPVAAKHEAFYTFDIRSELK